MRNDGTMLSGPGFGRSSFLGAALGLLNRRAAPLSTSSTLTLVLHATRGAVPMRLRRLAAAILAASALALPALAAIPAVPAIQPPAVSPPTHIQSIAPGALAAFGYAVSLKRIERVMAIYAPDVVAYDAGSGQLYKGADAYRKAWQDRLARYHGLTTFNSDSGTLVAEDNMISSYGVWQIDSHDASGAPTEDTAKVLDVFRKEAGAWKIVQETITWRSGPARLGQLHAAMKSGPRQAMVG
jgi:ketosteroid isomerase-like protein